MSGSDTDGVEEYDCIAQPTLIDQLKNILREYPDDGQIIKELIQNADDAGATCMKILYAGEKLNPYVNGEKKYRRFLRGPALVFYNNATFTDADWTGIRTIYNSVKATDPLTVGQFGLGFKSVFHITDYPCIVSNDRILFLNPLEKRSDKVCVTIKLSKLQQSKTIDVGDVLHSLDGIFGFSDSNLESGVYPGTIIWFPLRSEGTRLSENIYSESRVLDLFHAFMADAEVSLLFLKGLRSIHLYFSAGSVPDTADEHRDNTDINFGKDEHCFSAILNETNTTTTSSKAIFMKEVRELDGSVPNETLYKALSSDICLTRRQRDAADICTVQKWVTLNLYPGEPMTDELRALIDFNKHCYSPVVAIAACTERNSCLASGKQGKIFCFQPLPDELENRTGLPVHINAFFALTQNRRHIQLPSSNQEQCKMQVSKPIEWNLALMSDILPKAYVELVLGIIDLSRDILPESSIAELTYAIIPDTTVVNQKWTLHAEEVVTQLLDKRFLYTKAKGGHWISADEATFGSQDCLEAIEELLLMGNVKLVLAPNHILTSLEKRMNEFVKLSPEFLLQYIQTDASYKDLSPQHKIDLLHYLYDSDCKYDLDGLDLIPLENDEFASFGSAETLFVEKSDIVQLFPGMQNRFVSTKINSQTFRVFEDIAANGEYQVRKLEADCAKELIEQMMEKEFDSLLPPLKIDKGKSQKWKDLLKGLWAIIMVRFRDDIHLFVDLPLFPVFSKRSWLKVQSFSLYPLSSRLLLSRSDKDGKPMDAELCSLFELLSVNVIHNLPDWIDIKVLDEFVHRFTGPSLAELMGKLETKNITYFNEVATEKQKGLLLTLVSEKFNADVLGETAISMLAKLEIFQEVSSPKSVFKLVAAESSTSMVDCKSFPVRFPQPLLLLNSSEEEAFAGVLGVGKMKTEQLILETLDKIDLYSKNDVSTFIHWVLTNQFQERNATIHERVKSVPFLEVNKCMFKADELFDPSDSLLTSLFDGIHVFPTDQRFTSPKILPTLIEIGLKTRRDVACEDIYNVCKRLHTSGSYKHDNKTASHVLKFLNMNENHGLLKLSHEQISNLKWIPVRDENIMDMLLFNKGRGTLVSPLEVRSTEYRYLVGSISPLVDCKKYANVAEIYSWTGQPPLEDVVSQLLTIVNKYSSNRKHADVLLVVTAIYEWLDAFGNPSQVQMELDNVFDSKNQRYIWVGNGFMQKRYVIVRKHDLDIKLKPFICFLPRDLCHLESFFISIGCKKTLETSDYIDVLARIKDASDRKTPENPKKVLRVTISILNMLKDQAEKENIPEDCTIFVPVQSDDLLLKPAELCTYGNRHMSIEEGLLCVHEDVPVSTAEAVGVKSFKKQMMTELEGIEEWGQTEPLTRRLSNILKDGYIDGFSVPKELFQNADDAKASKLWILYDERENEDARTDLLDEGMAELQGPALWVYNDATFTEEDFRNITKLSGATKQPNSSKIGKFGLGFCSVYNLTDVPSFLSGQSIVVFDPHLKFLGKALPGKSPGLRINLRVEKNRRMLNRLCHQFMPFENIFGCKRLNEMSKYDGTLFRLPLRHTKSDISDIIYRGSEIRDLLSKIKQFSSNLLFFSQNVSEIRLFHLQNGNRPEDMRLLFSCQKSLLNMVPRLDHKSMLEEASRLKNNHDLENHPLKAIQTLSVKTEDCDVTFSGEMKWLIAWATGTEEKSLEMTDAEKGALPLAAVAVPFQSSDGEYRIRPIKDMPLCFYRKAHFFCFMPLPLEHEFSVHINGQFAVSSDRRRLRTVEEEDKRTVYRDWNESIMRDAVVKALVHLIENEQTLGKCENNSFYELWPHEDNGQFTQCLFVSFYKYILANDKRVFEKNGSWYPISKCVFLEPGLRSHEIGDKVFEVLNTFSTYSVAIDLPTRYYKYLCMADNDLIEQQTVDGKSFILRFFFPNISDVRGGDRNALLKYAIQLNNKEIDEWIKTHKSIPTQPHDNLRLPSEVVDMDSSVGPLFSMHEERFLSEDFSKGMPKDQLWKYGVIHDILPDRLLVERAERIEQLDKKCAVCGKSLCGLLIDYIVANNSSHGGAWEEMRRIRFLPVAIRPDDWPFVWEADGSFASKVKKIKLCRDHKQSTLANKPVYDKATALYRNSLRDYVGCSFFVFDAHVYSQRVDIRKAEEILHKCLGLKDKVDVRPEIVFQQIVLISESYEPSMDRHYVNGVMKKLYTFLNDDKLLPTIDFLDRDIIWTSGKFTRASKVSVNNFNLDCSPFLFDLQTSPSPLLGFAKLYKTMGIKDHFSPDDILAVLDGIANASKNKPVDLANRKGVVNLLESLCLLLDVHTLNYADLPGPIHAPDTNWILQDSKLMCFDDSSEVEKYDTMVLVNVDLTIKTAKSIGIKSLLTQAVQDSSDSIEFFQDEPLVTRLNNLLSGYPCDSGIFKELLQNADDAGAKEVHFLVDFNSYGNEVFDKSFECLQGPALCVFNDKPFTQNDLKGIQRLGKGSKGDDPSKTGQYGVGFNSVYNLTDAPSFLTKGPEVENGETLCIFDPMAAFLPRSLVTRERPGRRFKDLGTIRAKYKDVISPYNESIFSLDKLGTVFRFPLRTSHKEHKSDIKDNIVSAEDIYQMLLDFKTEAAENLVFLKNLCNIKISIRKREITSLEMDISVDIAGKDLETRTSYFKKHADMCKTFRQERAKIFSLPSLTAAYHMHMVEMERTTLQNKRTEYLVVQTIGYKDVKPHSSIQEKCKSGELGLLPQGGVACVVSIKKDKRTFKDVSSKGCRAFCFLPLPGNTGLPVHVNGHFVLDHEGRRGLWKSDNFDQTSCYKTLWNKSLIEHVITPAYVHLLDIIRKGTSRKIEGKMVMFPVVQNAIAEYNSFIPVKKAVLDGYWLLLLKSVFTCMVSQERAFLPSLFWAMNEKKELETWKARLTWLPLKSDDAQFPAYFTDVALGLSGEDDLGHSNTMLGQQCTFNNILIDIGMHIVVAVKDIRESMKSVGIDIDPVSPKVVAQFLCSYNQDRPGTCSIKVNTRVEKTDVKSVEHMFAIVKYCIKDKAYFLERIRDLPVFVTVNEHVRLISAEDPVFVTRFYDLFENVQRKFLCSKMTELFWGKEKTFLQGPELNHFGLNDFKCLLESSSLPILEKKTVYEWDRITPTKEWIKRVWEFFQSEVDGLPTEDKTDGFRNLLKLVDTTALIPTSNQSSNRSSLKLYLVPPCQLGVTMDTNSFQNVTLKCALKKLELLTLHEEVIKGNFPRGLYQELLEEVPNVKCPEKIANCLHINKQKITEAHLSRSEAEAVLSYLAENCADLKGVLQKVKDLPIFPTYEGRVIALSDQRKLVSLQPWTKIPKDGLHELAKARSTAFLNMSDKYEELYKALGVEPKSEEDLYLEYIVPNQETFQREQFYKHIEFLCTSMFPEKLHQKDESSKKQKLIKLLTSCKFIETRPGIRVCASELFNPRNKVFNKFCQKEELLPQTFDKDLYIMFFERLGLRSQMTVQLFKRFAKDISEKGKHLPIPQSLRNQSGRLLKVFTEMQKEIAAQPRIQDLANVPFIIPLSVPKDLDMISKPFLEKDRMVCFSESVFHDRLNTAWTVCPVLPSALKIDDCSLRNCLEMKPDEFAKVFVKHCRNIGEAVSEILKKPETDAVLQTINSVMDSIYEQLLQLKGFNQLNAQILKGLSDVSLVYFKEVPMILKAKEIVINCSSGEDVPPFFNKMPIQLGKYSDLFILLGAAKEPTVESYIRVLECLKNKCANEEMLGPDLFIAKRAVGNLLTCGVKGNATTFSKHTVMYLPTLGRRMEPAINVIYCDNNHLRKRIGKRSNYFLGLDELEIKNVTEEQCVQFFVSLPKFLQPVLLTEIVEEVVDRSKLKEKQNAELRSMELFIRTQQFFQGLVRLAKHAHKELSKAWEDNLEDTLRKKLGQFRLVAVSGMKTFLEMKTCENGEYKTPKRVPKTEETKPIHFEETNEATKVFVEIEANGSQWQDELKRGIAHHLNCFLKDCLKDELPLIFLGFFNYTNNPLGIEDMLDKKKIVSHTFTFSEEPSLFAKPGEIVPLSHHRFLSNECGVIYEYEFNCVAYELYDPVVDGVDNNDDSATDEPATYIFARIIRKLDQTESSPLLAQYEIDIGENNLIKVPSYRLFKFVRKTNTCREMVRFEAKDTDGNDGNQNVPKWEGSKNENVKGDSSSQGKPKAKERKSIHDVCKEIKEEMIAAWKEDEETRRRVFKRLCLRWHPDKNHDDQEFCTKVFQYLEECRRRLDEGQRLNDYSEGAHGPGSTSGGKSKASGSWNNWERYGEDSESWSNFFRRFNRQQQQQRERSQHERYGDSSYFEFEKPEKKPYPWPQAAAKWQKQARADLDFATECLRDTKTASYNWICYICHQAAEKSLRAAWFAKDANQIQGDNVTNLKTLANGLVDMLKTKADEICSITNDRREMTHPRLYTSGIPAHAYTRDNADRMSRLTEEILQIVKDFYLHG